MIDHIISDSGEIFARIDYHREVSIANFCTGSILEYGFPDRLAELISDYSEIVNSMALSLLDDVEAEIYSYGLRLSEKGIPVFNLEIEDKKLIAFFTRYPTGQGFLDKFLG